MTVLSALLQITVYSAVIYAALMLFKSLFKKLASPRLQYLVWFLLIARLLIPVTPDAGFSFFTVPAQQNAAAPADPFIEGTSLNNILYPTEIRPLAYPVMNVPQTGLEPGQTDSPTQNQMNKAAFQFDWISILIMAWAAGAAVSMIRVARSFRRLSRLIGDSGPAPFMLYALAEKIKSEINVTSDVKIAVVDKAVSPALSAGLRPVVIIPRRMLWMGEEQLEFALRHELMHFKRRDYLVCLLLVFLRAVYWFNPVVWLAARQIKTDMEPACDSAAAAFMDGEEKKRYVNTILNMYTGKPDFVLGMALQNNARKTAESRIRGIFMSRRSRNGTKAAAVLLASVLAVACFTTACQPTPEKPVVVNKNANALSDSLKATPAPEAAYDAPETFQKSFPAKDDRVTMNIDAAVDVPKVSAFPVVRITPGEFTSDFVKKTADVLFEGKTAYEPRTQMTKPEIEKEILELQQALADPEHSKSDGLTSGDPDTVAMVTKMFEDRIKNYQALMEAAPDEATPKESDFQFHPAKTYEDPAMYKEESDEWKDAGDDQSNELLDRYENGQRLIADATLDSGYYGRIDVSNYSGSGLRINDFSFYKSKTLNPNNLLFGPGLNQDTELPATDMTQDEAAQMSQNLLDQLGIADMVLTACSSLSSTPDMKDAMDPEETGRESNEIYGYSLTYQRTYGGIPTMYDKWSDLRLSYDEQYGPYYQHEFIEITINDDQIVSFRWVSPSGEAQTENANVELLPFDGIMNAFERQMSLEYTLDKLVLYAPENPDYEEYIAKIEYGYLDITRIELGMVRVQVKDKPGEYRMVPAWNFYGNEKLKWKDQAEEQTNIRGLIGNPPAVFQTINAIDGSIIDAALGY